MSDLDEINAATADFVAKLNAKNASGVADHYCDDGSVLPPGAPPMVGREAVQGFWKSMIDTGLCDVVITPTEIEVFGDHAIDRGTLAGKLGDQQVVGKYVVWWKRAEASWKLYNDIFNFDA